MDAEVLVSFFRIAQNLSATMRWNIPFFDENYDIDRKESVAEHVCTMGLYLMVLREHLPADFDFIRAYEFVLLHDLPEAVIGDISAVDNTGALANTHRTEPVLKRAKHEAEVGALTRMTRLLGPKAHKRYLDMFEAYEAQACIESRVVKALDRIQSMTEILRFAKGSVMRTTHVAMIQILKGIQGPPVILAIRDQVLAMTHELDVRDFDEEDANIGNECPNVFS